MKWLSAVGLLVCALPASAFAAPTVSSFIQFEKAIVRKTPTPFAPEIASLPYKTRVTVLGQTGSFFEVQAEKTRGFVVDRALLTRNGELPKSVGATSIDAEEARVVLAGKGFIEQAEAEYRQRNQSLNAQFSQLDEARQPKRAELLKFMNEGGL